MLNWGSQGRTSGDFVVCACRCCDEQYLIHAQANRDADSGYCARCENEITTLEAAYGEEKQEEPVANLKVMPTRSRPKVDKDALLGVAIVCISAAIVVGLIWWMVESFG